MGEKSKKKKTKLESENEEKQKHKTMESDEEIKELEKKDGYIAVPNIGWIDKTWDLVRIYSKLEIPLLFNLSGAMMFIVEKNFASQHVEPLSIQWQKDYIWYLCSVFFCKNLSQILSRKVTRSASHPHGN